VVWRWRWKLDALDDPGNRRDGQVVAALETVWCGDGVVSVCVYGVSLHTHAINSIRLV
jgi:hypothetical protein